MSQLYRSYRSYLEKKYKGVTYRLGVDGGFSCPNRGEDRLQNGCSFCDAYGVRSAYLGEELQPMKRQIEDSMKLIKKRYGATIFLLYLQAFSSTYGTVKQLKKIYDAALSMEDFKELIVSTRPDCIDQEKVDLLASYKRQNRDVWVELGLQSCHDSTLQQINRGHDYTCFVETFGLLKKAGIKVAVHVIFGLPGETHDMMMQTIEELGRLKPQGIKIHNLHIPPGSSLYKDFLRGELSFPGSTRHVEYLADAIERLPEDCLIMRIDTNSPGMRGKPPGHFANKTFMAEQLNRILLERHSFQGIYCQ